MNTAAEFTSSRDKPASIVAHCKIRSGLFVTVHVITDYGKARRAFSITYTWPGKGKLIRIHKTEPMLIPGNVVDLATTIATEELCK